MTGHTVKAYDQELGELRVKISGIGRMTRLQLDTVVEAFTRNDPSRATQIIERDSVIDGLEHDINRLTVHMLAARQPMAIDLRTIISALKIATDIERIADYVVNIAKQVLALNGQTIQPPLQNSVVTMMRIVQDMLSAIIEAYADADVEKAMAVRERDQQVDQLYSSLLGELRVCMTQDNQQVNAWTALLFIARCLERMGDHIKNVAEDIYFIVTGQLYDKDIPSDQ